MVEKKNPNSFNPIQRKKANELADSSAWYRTLFEHTSIITIIDNLSNKLPKCNIFLLEAERCLVVLYKEGYLLWEKIVLDNFNYFSRTCLKY